MESEREALTRLRDQAVDAEAYRKHARQPSARPVKELVAQVLLKRRYTATQADERLATAWTAAAGEFADVSRASGLVRGKLEVIVANSIAMQELSFAKRHILAVLAAELPDAKIKDLKLKIGSIKK